MTKIAWSALIISFAFLLRWPLCHVLVHIGDRCQNTRVLLCAQNVAVNGGYHSLARYRVSIVGIMVHRFGFLLDLSVMQLLIKLGDWVRHPFGTSRGISHGVIVTPFDFRSSCYGAGSLVMLLDDFCNEGRIFIAQ